MSSKGYKWIDRNNKRIKKASPEDAMRIRHEAQNMGLSLTKSGYISKSNANQQKVMRSDAERLVTRIKDKIKGVFYSPERRSIDRTNKAIKTWLDEPEMMEYITNKMKTFGIDPTAGGYLSKGKAAQMDPAVQDFIRWFQQNIGSEKQYKERISNEYGEDWQDLGMDISDFVNAYDVYSGLVDRLFKQFNTEFAHAVYTYYKVERDAQPEDIAAAIKGVRAVLDSDLPYTATREDFMTYVQNKHSDNPWE